MKAGGLAKSTVIVAVKNEASDVEFAKKVQSFANHQGLQLCLAHVMEARLRIPGVYGDILGGFDLSELQREPQEAEKHAANDHLRSLQSYLGRDENVETALIEHYEAGEGILHEAAARQAVLIAVEVQDELLRILPSGLSVVMTLMQKAAQPLLLLRHGALNRFDQANKTIVIADDLGPGSYRAVQAAMRLALAWKNTRVIHLHVVEEHMHAFLQGMRKLGRAMDLLPDHGSDWSAYVKRRAEIELERRMLEFTYALREAGCKYESLVTHGPVGREVNLFLRETQAELVVFGRSSHQHVFGRVSFASMLEGNDAVLIVPGNEN